VDAYTRLGMIAIFLLVVIFSSVFQNMGEVLATIASYLMLVYSFFALAWIIVGSILFWNKLNPLGVCYGAIHDYMYALLIISYVTIVLIIFLNLGVLRKLFKL
jgi:hypothetical protein